MFFEIRHDAIKVYVGDADIICPDAILTSLTCWAVSSLHSRRVLWISYSTFMTPIRNPGIYWSWNSAG